MDLDPVILSRVQFAFADSARSATPDVPVVRNVRSQRGRPGGPPKNFHGEPSPEEGAPPMVDLGKFSKNLSTAS
jgi:hypothetical protein